jgi:hypothetical protein
MAYYKMGLLFPLNLHHLHLASIHFRPAVQVCTSYEFGD